MENNNAHIIAISLGIPKAPHVTPTVTTTPTNNFDGILLEQQSPRIFTPVPQQPIPINELTRSGINEEEEDIPKSTSLIIWERRSPTTPRRRTPVITIASTIPPSPDYASYVSQTPSPGTSTRFTTCVRGFDMGRDTRSITPTTNYDPWADRYPTSPPAASIASEEFWDNIDIPYSAYFPSGCDSPDHCTPPPTGYNRYRMWDQPIQNQELTPKPVPAAEEPVASSSTHLYPTRHSGWQNVRSPHRSPRCPP
ncbi:hypothetical protein ARMGADRAFT_1071076 [Armillaria gallica]|uniref:Uncharacterized protein n=1 Tax=Armillaria gallica TaxID=47427 RepID=A0A2H3E270_ARMGA|nr:hypothetical protein ARMGADRAFT_1071076 [Armillaria gallica]